MWFWLGNRKGAGRAWETRSSSRSSPGLSSPIWCRWCSALGAGLSTLFGQLLGLGLGAALAGETVLALARGLLGRGLGVAGGLLIATVLGRVGATLGALIRGAGTVGGLRGGLGLGLGGHLEVGGLGQAHEDLVAHAAVQLGAPAELVPVLGLGDPGGQDAGTLALERGLAKLGAVQFAEERHQFGLVAVTGHDQLAGDQVDLLVELSLDLLDRGVSDEAHGATGLCLVVAGLETRGLDRLHVQGVGLVLGAAQELVLELAQSTAGHGRLHGQAQGRERVELEVVQAQVLCDQVAHVALLTLVDGLDHTALLLDAEHAGDAAGLATGQVVLDRGLGLVRDRGHDLTEEVGQDLTIRAGDDHVGFAVELALERIAELVRALVVPHRGVGVAARGEDQVALVATQVVRDRLDHEELAGGVLAIRVLDQGLPGIQ